MWCCSCKAENKISSSTCVDCGAVMPQRERDRIYREQLKYAQKKQLAQVIEPLVKFLKPVLGDADFSADSLTDVLFALVRKAADTVMKYSRIIVTVFVVLALIVGFSGLTSYSNRRVLERTHFMSSVKRETFTNNAVEKLREFPELFEYYWKNPANSVNEEYTQRFEEKKAVVAGNAQKVTDTVTGFIKKIGEELKR